MALFRHEAVKSFGGAYPWRDFLYLDFEISTTSTYWDPIVGMNEGS